MDGVGTPIIGRPRPIPGHDTPNPANNTYTLNYEEPVTAPPKPSTDMIELGRRTARGYRNSTNDQLRMLLIAGGLDASTHTQL